MQNAAYIFQISILPVCDYVVCDLLLSSFSKTDCNLQNQVTIKMLIQHPVHQGEMGKKQIIPTCIFLFACSISLMADTNKIIPVVSNSFTKWNIAVMEISEKPLNALNTTSYMITSAYTIASLLWKPIFSCPRAIPYSHAKFCKSQWISSSSHQSANLQQAAAGPPPSPV